MRRVTLEFSDEAWRRLANVLMVRKIACQEWGVIEQVVAKFIEESDAELGTHGVLETTVTYKTKEEREREKTT